jgi:hypothetical protein
MDFHEKAARNELPIFLKRVPELATLPEEEQIRLIAESRRFDSGARKILIGGLVYLAITMPIFWYLPTLSPEMEKFMGGRKGAVFVGFFFMAPVLFVGLKLRISQQTKKLRALIARGN